MESNTLVLYCGWRSQPAATAYPFVDKLLDVEAGRACIVVGTVYMEMALKPNILEEVASEVRLATRTLTKAQYRCCAR